MSLRTFKITLAYDGTGYVGWQRQASGASVQGALEDALGRIEGTAVAVAGAGRTDAGAHALGQVASARMASAIAPAALRRALNASLSTDLRVLDVEEAPPGFHARLSARAKMYRYCIANGELVTPFDRRYVWHVSPELDVERMAAAACLLEGRHDFAAFQAAGSSVRSALRILSSSVVRVWEPDASDGHRGGGAAWDVIAGGERIWTRCRLLTYDVTGDGFLRHMVRIIVGTLVEIGSGRRDADSMRHALRTGNRAQAGRTAPAQGLFLVGVEYNEGSGPRA